MSGKNPTMQDLESYIKALGEAEAGLEYEKTSPADGLPPMRYKIDGTNWSLITASTQLLEYMSIWGYGHSGRKVSRMINLTGCLNSCFLRNLFILVMQLLMILR